ncbi:MAG TPA: M14 family zinc carboxypeptidase [Nannocystaceae bacterium]|nr:M14 family zinc carboxypeptidase [Nannocystaceae bacterium]
MIASLLAFAPPLVSGSEQRYDGHAIVRVDAPTPADLATVTAIAEEVWTHRPGPGLVDVRVAPDRMAELEATGLVVELAVADLQPRIDAERDRLANAPDPAEGGAWFSDFRDYDDVMTQLEAMAASAPDIAQVIDVGSSLEGRPIKGLRIGKAGAPAVMYTGTIHAREWLATMVAMCVADAYIGGYGSDAHITELVDDIGIVVVPILNPDGYVVSWTADRYWRKNTRDGYGVDLNRNFDIAWGGEGASGNPSDETYYGEAPFSEPESAAVRDLVAASPEIVAHIDFHSFSTLVLYPWGHTYDPAPDDAQLSMLASAMSNAMANATSWDYPAIQASDLYPASGCIDDWNYGENDMMAFTIELRGDDFVVPPSQIAPACSESIAAALVLADWVLDQAGGPSADDGGSTGASDEAGDEHPDPTLDDGGDAAGTTGALEGSGHGDDEAANGDDGPGGTGGGPSALPPGFGLGSETASGCAIASTTDGRATLAILLPLVFRRRRRRAHGT